MHAPKWMIELSELAERYRETGVIYDLPAMSEKEALSALRWLRRYDRKGRMGAKA